MAAKAPTTGVTTSEKHRLAGSERPRPKSSKLIGPADPGAQIGVLLLIRPPPDSLPLPDLEYWQKTPPKKRKFLTSKQYVKIYGATKHDMDTVLAFVKSHEMSVLDSHAGRSLVSVRASPAQINSAFGVAINVYESPSPTSRPKSDQLAANEKSATHTHYGFDGSVYLPASVASVVTAVIGLDTRSVGAPAGRVAPIINVESQPTGATLVGTSKTESGTLGTGDPTGAGLLYVPQAAQYYEFPTYPATNQVIGIIAPQGYQTPGVGASYIETDITTCITQLGEIYGSSYGTTPTQILPVPLTVHGYKYVNNPTAISSALPAGLTTQQINQVIGTFPGSYWVETTQDISTSAAIAQGASINVYFTEDTESGWVVYLSQVLAPDTEPQPTVLSASYVLTKDDSTIGSLSDPASTASVISNLFQRLAGQGINAFNALGDWGADDEVVDGSTHVSYPGSDPWGISCGGTVLRVPSATYPEAAEVVWSDAWNTTSTFGPPSTAPSDFGATGGGVSATFPTAPYQIAANISIPAPDTSTHTSITSGRFVPDIAGMVGFQGFYINGLSYGFVGTSCVAPLYAGLTAVLLELFGTETQPGFLNTTFYQLGASKNSPFNDIISGNNDSGDNPDSSYFLAGSGWDPCSGWGSINGTNLLNGIASQLFTQSLYFRLDKSSYGLSEAVSPGSFPSAFEVVLEGYNRTTVGDAYPTVTAVTWNGISFTGGISQTTPNFISYESDDDAVIQRISFSYTVSFTAAQATAESAGGIFPDPGSITSPSEAASYYITLNASITLPAPTSGPSPTSAQLFLTPGLDPYFLNINPDENNAYYLSNDLRVFTVTPGINATPFNIVDPSGIVTTAGPTLGSPTDQNPVSPSSVTYDSTAAFLFIQQLVAYFNAQYSDPGGIVDPFATESGVIPNEQNALTGDSSVTPYAVDPANPPSQGPPETLGLVYPSYNFALARVRLNSQTATTSPVRVFFRLFLTQSNDTDYDPNTTYVETLDSAGFPLAPSLPSDISTIPFFATGNYLANTDYPTSGGNTTNSTIIEPQGADGTWQYYGCYLNVYDLTNTLPISGNPSVYSQQVGTHHCIVAQIAYDGAPIPQVPGVTQTCDSCDKLAQHNLQITLSDNPGPASAHRIPQTFDLRPSASFTFSPGDLTTYPDELRITWGNVPAGSTASIYWPAVSASTVLGLAKELYSTHQLSAADSHTIQVTVPYNGTTYVPIPSATSTARLAGLFTIDLPVGVSQGEEFVILVERLTTGQYQVEVTPPPPPAPQIAAVVNQPSGNYTWRYVVGTFQVRIPVTTAAVMLAPRRKHIGNYEMEIARNVDYKSMVSSFATIHLLHFRSRGRIRRKSGIHFTFSTRSHTNYKAERVQWKGICN